METTELNDGLPRTRPVIRVWVDLDHLIRLDQEIMKRIAANRGKRSNDINRSAVIRDAIDKLLPPA